jgi:hypothetical protein
MNYTLSLEQVATDLQVCTRTVRNRLKSRGNYSDFAKKIGRYWRFSPAVFASEIALPG